MYSGRKRPSQFSNNNEPPSKKQKMKKDSKEIDPLDAFMMTINETAKKQKKKALKKQKEIQSKTPNEIIKNQQQKNKKGQRVILVFFCGFLVLVCCLFPLHVVFHEQHLTCLH